ncbi:MAG TPA: isoprenylcysteine carboxylmethyltransferase family protein [Candidatus Dormibacteraeota bacterium]|nr:isoprenylcysteine carboxylmethyltransferase family protein [Candidatus Dormibacteraeota bacterium]
MAAEGLANTAGRRSGAYWRDLLLGRLVPSLFFSLFLAREFVLLWGGVQGVRQPLDLLFVAQQVLALAYFALLVVLYAVRLPQRGTDHRLAVIFIAFSGTFAAISASFLPGGTRREGLVLVADVLATVGLAYSVWGLAYLRRSFSIIPEARRLVTGGPYALSRHPVYVGEVTTAIGVNLATAGWLSALAIAYFVACELLRIRWEERILALSFPSEYPEYARRVPRYLPNPFGRR